MIRMPSLTPSFGSRRSTAHDSNSTVSSSMPSTPGSPISSAGCDGECHMGKESCSRHNTCACQDEDSWLEEFPDDFLEVSDELPTQDELEIAGDIPIYDAQGAMRPFKSLYTGLNSMGQRQLIIFIRHFYCGACKAYVNALTRTITPSAYFTLAIPTRITIIGCGEPTQIAKYVASTGCPFEIFADPTRQLHKTLGMVSTARPGSRPDYLGSQVGMLTLLESMYNMMRAGIRQTLDAGPITQVGGEFMFEEGLPTWCHRMRNVRGHAQISVLTKLLGLDTNPTRPVSKASLQSSVVSNARSLQRDRSHKMRLIREGDGTKAFLGKTSRLGSIEEPQSRYRNYSRP